MATYIDFFKSELASGDTNERREAVLQAAIVAEKVGPALARTHLMPMLKNVAVEDTDEVLYELAQVLGGEFLGLLGGEGEAGSILAVLEAILVHDGPAHAIETVVREKAVATFLHVHGKARGNCSSVDFSKLLRSLAENSAYQRKLTACDLIGEVYPELQADKGGQNLVQIFERLAKDTVPMVRRAAACNFSSLTDAVLKDDNVTNYEPLVAVAGALLGDMDESVRVAAVAGCLEPLTQLHDGDKVISELVPILIALCGETSWRIKQAVAQQIDKLFARVMPMLLALDGEDYAVLAQAYQTLLTDPELEVRKSASLHLGHVCSILGSARFSATVWPAVPELMQDPEPGVRNVLVQQSPSLLGFDAGRRTSLNTNQRDVVIKAFSALLGDEDAVVRAKAVEVFIHDLLHLVPGEMQVSMVTQLYKQARDGHTSWRVVSSIIDALPRTTLLLTDSWKLSVGGLAFLSFVLRHDVAAVRKNAAAKLPDLEKVYGADWVKENILPMILSLFNESQGNYHWRLAFLQASHALLSAEPTHAAALKPAIDAACSDTVPNVRCMAMKNLPVLCAALGAAATADYKADFKGRLATEADMDVHNMMQDFVEG